MLFHHRLGYINFRTLSDLATKHLLHKLPASLPSPTSHPRPPCIDCAQSKLREQPHPPTESISAAPLDRVHMDLWVLAPVRSCGGHFYFLVIIDDYSRYMSVHLLTSKSKAPAVIIEWARQAHTQLNTKIIPSLSQTVINKTVLLRAATASWSRSLAASSLTPPPLLSEGTPCSMLLPFTISILILTMLTPPLLSCGLVKSLLSALFVYKGAPPMSSSSPKPVVQLAANLLPKQPLAYVFFDESHPFYTSSKASPSLLPPSLTWTDLDRFPVAATPSPPLPAPSTISDPPPPASPSSTTHSLPLLPSSPPTPSPPLSSPPALAPAPAPTPPTAPIPLTTYQRRHPALAPAPSPAPAPIPPVAPLLLKTYQRHPPAPTPAPALAPALAPTPTSPTATPPPAPPPSPIAYRTRSHGSPKLLSLSI
ncbi:unnamed protein product [Closterium sp. NIES-54]